MNEQTFIEKRLVEIADQLDRLRADRLREMFPVDEAAKELGCSTDVVYRLIRDGHLPAVRHTGTSRGMWVRLSDLLAYVESLEPLERSRHLEAAS